MHPNDSEQINLDSKANKLRRDVIPSASPDYLRGGAIRYFVVSGPGSAPVLPYLLSNKTDTKQLRRVDLPYTNDDNDERGDESVLSTSSGDEAENSEADGNDAFFTTKTRSFETPVHLLDDFQEQIIPTTTLTDRLNGFASRQAKRPVFNK